MFALISQIRQDPALLMLVIPGILMGGLLMVAFFKAVEANIQAHRTTRKLKETRDTWFRQHLGR
jgi:hypothetical protein